MTSRDFVYWLQGLFELADPKQLDQKQTDLIKRHLAMVFVHEIDPAAGPPAHQAKLDVAHANEPLKIGGTAVAPDGSTIVYRC